MKDQNRPLTMRNRLWFAGTLVCAFLIILVSCSACGAQQFPDMPPTKSDPTVAKLVQIVNGEEAGFCTAWKIAEDRLMTAGHCCEKSDETDKVTYTARGTHAIPGEMITVLYDDDDHDVCVMKGHLIGAPIKLALRDPMMGDTVWTAGYPRTEYLISSGYWSGRTEENQGKASVAVYGGASGSPVLNTSGEAIGVLVAYYPPMSNLALLSVLEWMKVAKDMAQ